MKYFLYTTRFVFILLLAALLPGTALGADLQLTSQERAWLDAHPKIVVGGETDWAPFDFVNEKGEYRGIANDYLQIIGKKLGIEVEIITGPAWNELLTLLERKEIDIIPAIYYAKEREDYLRLTSPYMKVTEFIFSRSDDDSISDFVDLQNKTTVVVKGYTVEGLLRSQYPSYKLVTAPTIKDALEMIITNKADAFVGDIISTPYLMREVSLVGIKPVAPVPFEAPKVHMGVRKDWPILATLIDKVFKAISPQEHDVIRRNWVGLVERKINTPASGIVLTPEEQIWIKENPVIRVHNETASPPFNFAEQGRPKGFSIDYMKLLAQKAGLGVEFITGPSWGEFLDMMKDGKLDVMLNIARTPEREKFLSYTPAYVTLVQTLYTRKDFPLVRSVKDLYGKRIALPKGFYIIELLKPYPEVEIVEVRDLVEAMQMVSVGKADALYDLMPAINYLAGTLQITNLKVGGDLGIESGRPMPLHLAVPKAEGILADILSKSMASISDEEYQAISDKWLELPTTQADALDLTMKEKAWISEHPEISVNGGEWPPFIIKKGNVHEGISVDILERAAELAGLKVKYNDGPWPVMMEMLKKGELDLAQCISKTPERDEYLSFTDSYLSPHDVVFVNEANDDIHSIADLNGKVVAVEDSTHLHELLMRDYPNITVLPVASALEGVRGVSSGQVDAYIGTPIVAQYTAQKNLIHNLKIVADIVTSSNNLRFGSRKENGILIGILQKAINAIPESEIDIITASYIQPISSEIGIDRQRKESAETVSYKSLIISAAIVFAILIILAVVLLRVMKSEQVAASFGSTRFRLLVLVGLTGFVVVVVLSGWLVLDDIKSKTLADVATTLKIRVQGANDSLEMWVEERKSLIRAIGQSQELVDITERLLDVEHSADVLKSSPALADARAFFKSSPDVFPNIGFFIIGPDDISLGSMRDSNVGLKNLIVIQRPDIMKRAFAGEVLFVPPIKSDVVLDESSDENMNGKMPQTMFFIGPVKNNDGKVIAVMTLRVDPTKGMSKIMHPSRGVSDSFEAYTFNKDGILMSQSRFEPQLRELGLLGAKSSSAMNVALKDPGVNLLEKGRSLESREGLPLTLMVESAIKQRRTIREIILDGTLAAIEINVQGYRDYRGVTVYGAWIWNSKLDLGLAAEIDAEDALGSYFFIRTTVFWILGFTLVLSVGAVLLVLAVGERTRKVMEKGRIDLEKRVEERTAQLKESEEHSRLILASMGEGLFQVDTDGTALFINSAAAAMLGYTPTEILGQPIHDLIHHTHADGSSYDVTDCPMNHAFTRGVSQKVGDEVLWRKDGTPFPVEYSATPILEGDSIVGAVIVFRDITERLEAEEQLQATKNQLQEILQTSPIAVAFSSKNIIRFTNHAFEELFGVGIGDESPNLYVNPEDRNDIITILQRDGLVTNREVQLYNKHQQERNMLISYLPITFDGEEGILGWLLDITERKQIELTLQESENDLRGKVGELDRFRRIAVGREHKMIALKKEINALLEQLGSPEKYKIH